MTPWTQMASEKCSNAVFTAWVITRITIMCCFFGQIPSTKRTRAAPVVDRELSRLKGYLITRILRPFIGYARRETVLGPISYWDRQMAILRQHHFDLFIGVET